MLDGIKNLLGSEKAIACGVLVVAATVLVGMGQMTIDQWIDYTKVIAVVYVGGKTVQGAATVLADSRVKVAEQKAKAPPEPVSAPAAAPAIGVVVEAVPQPSGAA